MKKIIVCTIIIMFIMQLNVFAEEGIPINGYPDLPLDWCWVVYEDVNGIHAIGITREMYYDSVYNKLRVGEGTGATRYDYAKYDEQNNEWYGLGGTALWRISNEELLDLNNAILIYNTFDIYDDNGNLWREEYTGQEEIPSEWYENILNWVMEHISGIFQGLATPFQNIAEGINNIFQLFNPANQQNIFRIMFVPRPEFIQANITALYGVIEEKIPLLNDLIVIVKGLAENLLNAEVNTPPEFKITMPAKWGGFEAKIIDFSMYVPYRFFIKNIIRAIAWYFFIKRLLRRMPTIIY